MYRCNGSCNNDKGFKQSIVRFLCEKHFLLDSQKKKKQTKKIHKNCWNFFYIKIVENKTKRKTKTHKILQIDGIYYGIMRTI